MYKFSDKSKKRLETCHYYLQLIFNEAIKLMDFAVLEGRRNEEKQNNYFHAGKSKLQYPNSRHNKEPLSEAIDVSPYPIDWNDRERFILLAGIVHGIAHKLGIQIRWGGSWNGIDKMKENTFNDLVHYELIL